MLLQQHLHSTYMYVHPLCLTLILLVHVSINGWNNGYTCMYGSMDEILDGSIDGTIDIHVSING